MQPFLTTLTKTAPLKHKFSVVTAISGDTCELCKLIILLFLSYSNFWKHYPLDTAGSALTDSSSKHLKASSVFRFFSRSKALRADVSKDFSGQTKNFRFTASMATEVLKEVISSTHNSYEWHFLHYYIKSSPSLRKAWFCYVQSK